MFDGFLSQFTDMFAQYSRIPSLTTPLTPRQIVRVQATTQNQFG